MGRVRYGNGPRRTKLKTERGAKDADVFRRSACLAPASLLASLYILYIHGRTALYNKLCSKIALYIALQRRRIVTRRM